VSTLACTGYSGRRDVVTQPALGSLYLSAANEGWRLFVKAISVLQVQMEQMSMATSLQVIPQKFADRERGLFDIRGFLAGLVLSWAIGAVLYIYLTVT
jgi:hypothetical protein